MYLTVSIVKPRFAAIVLQKASTVSEVDQNGILLKIASAMPDAVIAVQRNGAIRFFNAAAELLFGYSADEAVGANIAKLLPANYADQFFQFSFENDEKSVANMPVKRFDIQGLTKRGEIITLSVACSGLDIDGEGWFLGVVRDVSALRNREDRLLYDVELYFDLLNNINLSVILLDHAGRILLLNKYARNTLMSNDIEPVGMSISELLANRIPDSTIVEKFDRSVPIFEPEIFTTRGPEIEGNGVPHDIRWRQSPFGQSPAGQLRTLVLGLDVTQYHAAIDRLVRREDEATFSQSLSQTGIWVWQIAQDIVSVSDEGCRLFGFDPTTGMENRNKVLRYSDFLALIVEGDRMVLDQAIRKALNSREGFNVTLGLGEIDESLCFVRILGRPFYDEQGNPKEMRGTVQDISAEEKTAKALIEARDSAQLANRSKTDFLANMSHELRTPLNAVIGFSDLIKSEVMGPLGHEKYREYITDINSSGRHLLSIINDILDMSKIEAGHLELQESVIDLQEILSTCMRLVKPRADVLNINLVLDIADDVPRLFVDERLFRQSVLNLLSNAVKFTLDRGQIITRARLLSDNRVEIAVEDSGIGMTEPEVEIALRPFVQVDSRLTRKFEGTGLGLPLVKELTELHGGELNITSTPGTGTTARLIFPSTRTRNVDPDNDPMDG